MKASLNLSNDHILCPFSLENRAANIGMSVTSLCSGRGFYLLNVGYDTFDVNDHKTNLVFRYITKIK